VKAEMKKLGVVPIKADYTQPSPLIDKWLERFGKGGVPMYVVLPADPGKEPWTLPEVLTPGLVVEALRKAAAGTPAGAK
jgi:thiol:disulfide interchange protein DsbD